MSSEAVSNSIVSKSYDSDKKTMTILLSDGCKVKISFRHKDGFFWCYYCRVNWCEHLELVMKVRAELPLLWDSDDSFKEELIHNKIFVPFMPTRNCWARVDFVSRKYGYLMYMTRPDTNSLRRNIKVSEREYIGLTGPGDSLTTWRLMIWDWFKPYADSNQENLVCENRWHQWKQEQIWQLAMTDVLIKYAEWWSVDQTGHCLACNESALLQHTEDLAPESIAAGFSSLSKTKMPKWTFPRD